MSVAEIYSERAGSGEPLLLIQGMGGTHLSWGEAFAGALAQDFATVAFDNRGIGLSAPVEESFTVVEMAADALALLDRLEIETTHVLGISMGGMIAQELALAAPERVRTLVLGCTYCGGPGSSLMAPEDFARFAEARASGNRDAVFRISYELNLSPGFRAGAGADGYREFVEMAGAVPVRPRTVEMQAMAIAGHDTSTRLGGLTAPTLVIHGTADRVLRYPNGPLIDSLLPNSRLQTLEDVGHMFWWEQPERSAELVRTHALGA